MSALSDLLNAPPVLTGKAREPLGGEETRATSAPLTGGEAFNELYGWGARESQAEAAAAGQPWKPDLTKTPAKTYYAGDEVRRFAAMPVERRAKIQQRLDEAGLMPATYVRGMWDAPTQAAMQQAMTYANQAGTTWQDVVRQYAAAPRQGAPGEGFMPEPYLPPDVPALAEHLQTLASQYLDRELDTDELRDLVERMQGTYEQAHAVTQANAEQTFVAGQGADVGDLEAVPDVAARTQQLFQQEYGEEMDFRDDQAQGAEDQNLLGSILGAMDEVA